MKKSPQPYQDMKLSVPGRSGYHDSALGSLEIKLTAECKTPTGHQVAKLAIGNLTVPV